MAAKKVGADLKNGKKQKPNKKKRQFLTVKNNIAN